MSVRARLGRFFDGSMRANAVALVVHQLASAALGFVYWLLAARLYAVETVGTSAAVISTLQLVSGIAQLGLVGGMQRFIPRAGRHARRLASSAYAIATASAALSGLLAVWLASVFAPERQLLGSIPPVWLVLAAMAWTLFYLQDGVLVGLREAVWVLIENFAYNLSKIILLVIGAQLLARSGIVVSWFLPVPLAVLLVTWLVFGRLLRREQLREHPDPADQVTAREVVRSISGDHVGSLVNEAAIRLLPLLVVRLAGAAENAYFYQAWMISTVLALVASGMSNSFTAETAADRTRVGENSRNILRTMALLLVPAAVIIAAGAPFILGVFGPAYAREGTVVLRLLAVAILPTTINAWYVSYLRVMGHIRRLVALQTFTAVALISMSYVGLRSFGISGVALAYLLTQTAAAIYALTSTRSVLASGSARETRGLRRADWRYLLPVTPVERVALFASGSLAESAQVVGGVMVPGDRAEGDCDLAVVGDASTASLAEAVRSLRPGGTCYAEWRLPASGGLRRILRRLEMAGLEAPSLYWPATSLRHPRLWVRVPVPDRAYESALRLLLAGASPQGWMRSGVDGLIGLAVHIGILPDVVSLARKPGGPEDASDFAGWLEAQVNEAAGPGAQALAIMRTGGTYDASKVGWSIFDRRDASHRWVAKAPRHPDSRAYLEREYQALGRLATRSAESRDAVRTPEPVLRAETPGFPIFVQTAVHGVPLLEVARSEGYRHAALLVTRSLTAIAARSSGRPSDSWRDEHVEHWLRRLGSQLEGVAEDGLVERARAALGSLRDVSPVWAHNDCAPWNVLVSDCGLEVFDWETADEYGMPAVDLVYCLATLAFSLDRLDGTPRAVESYRSLLDRSHERGQAFRECLGIYAEQLGLAEAQVDALRVLTWLTHTTHGIHNLFSASAQNRSALLAECVCLPMLRLEVERAEDSRRRRENGAGQPEYLFISPHLDDAVLSCGSAIGRFGRSGGKVTVVSVFTDDLGAEEEPSPLAQRCHDVWGTGDGPFRVRREEDLAAAEALGCETLHLGFRDAIYRRGASGEPLYHSTPRCTIADGDARCLGPIASRLRQTIAEHPGAVVFGPAGIGGHVDHVLVREALESIAPKRLVYYDEYPYVAWTMNTYAEHRARSASYRLRPTEAELDAQVRASDMYRTQLPGLFPSAFGRLCLVLRERLPMLCSWLPASPGVLEAASRRMSRRVRGDRARYGERYHWSDLGWTGPFAD